MIEKKYKIAYLSFRDPEDKASNSGIQYYMLNALREQGNVVDVYYPSGFISKFILKVLYRIYHFRYPDFEQFSNWPVLFRFLGVYFSTRLMFSFKKYELMFASRGAHLIPFLKSELPLIYTSDITYQLMLEYYKGYADLPKIFYESGQFKEKATISRSALCIYPSNWAANSAINDYMADSDKVASIASGANFDSSSIPSLAALASQRREKSVCKILFVGRDWNVKGGGIAFNAVRILNQQGIKATLTVIGCLPPFKDYPDWLTVIKRLDKNIPEQNQKLMHFFANAHIFFVPTRHEAFGLVFAEACAYGLPCLATNTGGVPMIVKHNYNGYLFNIQDGAEVYARQLSELWKDAELYDALSKNARRQYDEVLNWGSWGRAVQTEIERVLG